MVTNPRAHKIFPALHGIIVGVCPECGMTALLCLSSRLSRAEILTGAVSSNRRGICLTCDQTPEGIDSVNARHQRLSDAEYAIDREQHQKEKGNNV